MAVSLEARDVAIFRVDQIHRLALLGSKEELPVAGCRLPLSPAGGHGQGGVGLHDHGERPLIAAAFDMPPRDPQQFPDAVRVGRRRHLAQPKIDAFRQQPVHRSEETTSELSSPMTMPYALFC